MNAIGGTSAVWDAFRVYGVELKFLRALPFDYAQSEQPFIPCRILDVMMFNPVSTVSRSCGRLRAGLRCPQCVGENWASSSSRSNFKCLRLCGLCAVAADPGAGRPRAHLPTRHLGRAPASS